MGDREKMRAEIRSLRDSWENHIDYMNTINKTIEALLLKKSGFEESFAQLQTWLQSTSSKVTTSVPISSNLGEKRSVLQDCKKIQQDIASHQSVFDSLKEKLVDTEKKAELESCYQTYLELQQRNKKSLDIANVYV